MAFPAQRVLRAGDIVGLDIAAMYDGFHADAAITVGVGEITDAARHLLHDGGGAGPGSQPGHARAGIWTTSARRSRPMWRPDGCSVVRGLVGPRYRPQHVGRTAGAELPPGYTRARAARRNGIHHRADGECRSRVKPESFPTDWTIVTDGSPALRAL